MSGQFFWFTVMPFVFTLTALYTTGLARYRHAWAINAGGMALWIVYALATHQYGFITGDAVSLVLSLRNWWIWPRVLPRTGDD